MFLESFIYKLNSEPQDLGKRKKLENFGESIQPQEPSETILKLLSIRLNN